MQTKMAMEQEQHPLNLGKLLVNFQSLEFVLRAFLYESEKGMQPHLKLDELKEGEIVAENALTSYDSLYDLIDKYNQNERVTQAGLTIDRTIVSIRDAIAHGRVFGNTPQPPMTLLKFSRPHNKRVKVTFSVQLTRAWFNKQVPRVQRAALVVTKALEMLQQGKL